MEKIQQKPLVESTTPKYDQVLITCSMNPESNKGTVKIVDVLRTNVRVADSIAELDNKGFCQDSPGQGKFWVKTGTTKSGETYNATEEGTGSGKYLVIGSLYSEIVVKTVATEPVATEPVV